MALRSMCHLLNLLLRLVMALSESDLESDGIFGIRIRKDSFYSTKMFKCTDSSKLFLCLKSLMTSMKASLSVTVGCRLLQERHMRISTAESHLLEKNKTRVSLSSWPTQNLVPFSSTTVNWSGGRFVHLNKGNSACLHCRYVLCVLWVSAVFRYHIVSSAVIS